MRFDISKCAAPLGVLVACALMLGLMATPSSANVYATDLKWSAPAVNVNTGSPSVQLSYRLNIDARVGVTIRIYKVGVATPVHTANLGPQSKGVNTYTWNLTGVDTGVEYYFTVEAADSGFSSWTLISEATNQNLKFYNPRSIAVNKNPNSPYFGRVYVMNVVGGTTTAPLPPQRTLTKGMFALNADLTDALGQGDAGITGGGVFTTSAASPLTITIGPDDKIYMFDWTDDNSGVFVAPGDLSGNWPALLAPANRFNQPEPKTQPITHGSISSGVVVGKGLSRTIYWVDEDLRAPNDTLGRSQGSLWYSNVGPLDKQFLGLPTLLWNDQAFNIAVNFGMGLARDEDGNFWISQNRFNGTDVASLWKVSAAGDDMPLWRSLQNWGSPDPLRGNVGAHVAIDPPRNRMATPATSPGGFINVFNYRPTPDIGSLQAVGGAFVAWIVGDSSTAFFSSNNGVSFSSSTVPTPGVKLNSVYTDSSTTAGLNGWAVGNGGKIFRINNRTGYTEEPSFTTANLKGVTVIRTTPHGWAVGDNGTILFNFDGGWATDASPTTANLNAITNRAQSFSNPPIYDLYAVGDGGTILRRINVLGDTWEVMASPTTQNLNGVSTPRFALSAATTTVFAVGNNGTILKSTNAGAAENATFTELTSGTTANLYGVWVVDTSTIIAVGANGTILRTNNGGTTWTPVTSGVSSTLRSVWFYDAQTGLVSGDNGVLLRTTNAGQTWNAVTGVGSQAINSIIGFGTGQGQPRSVTFDAVGNMYVGNNITEVMTVFAPPDGANSYTTPSYFKFVPTNGDATVPATPVVTAPPVSTSTTTLSASWTATGTAYRYAIGVTAEDQGDYVVGWTNTTSNSVNVSNLSLQSGVTYFFYVQARSATGVWSGTGISAGTLVLETIKVGAAKNRPDGTLVAIPNVVVTKSGPDSFWVQEQDRSAGIRVVSNANPPANTLVTISGTMGTSGPEKVLNATSVTTGAPFTPVPLGVTGKNVAGSKVTNGTGLPNDGLLVTIWGKVTGVDFFDNFFFVDDGSGVVNETPAGFIFSKVPGIKIAGVFGLPSDGDYLKVTGIVRLQTINGITYRWIEPRDDSDVVYNP